MEVDRRLHLLAIHFIGHSQQGVPESDGDSEIRSDAPRILNVIFELIGLEIARNQSSCRQETGSGGTGHFVGVVRVDRGQQTGNCGHSVVVVGREGIRDCGKSEGCGIEALPAIGDLRIADIGRTRRR